MQNVCIATWHGPGIPFNCAMIVRTSVKEVTILMLIVVGIGKWNPYVNGPFFLGEEEEERKGGDKEVEAGEESRGEGKGAAEEHPPFESLLRGEFPYEVDE